MKSLIYWLGRLERYEEKHHENLDGRLDDAVEDGAEVILDAAEAALLLEVLRAARRESGREVIG